MRKIVYDNLIKVCIKTHLHKGAELELQNLHFLTFQCFPGKRCLSFSALVLHWDIRYWSDTWHIHLTEVLRFKALIEKINI